MKIKKSYEVDTESLKLWMKQNFTLYASKYVRYGIVKLYVNHYGQGRIVVIANHIEVVLEDYEQTSIEDVVEKYNSM